MVYDNELSRVLTTAWELVTGCMLAFYYLCLKECSPLGSQAQRRKRRVMFSNLGGWSELRKSRRSLRIHDENQGGNSAEAGEPGTARFLPTPGGWGSGHSASGRGQRTREVWVSLMPPLGLGGGGAVCFPQILLGGRNSIRPPS